MPTNPHRRGTLVPWYLAGSLILLATATLAESAPSADHSSVRCGSCHQGGRAAPAAGAAADLAHLDQQCLGCHEPDGRGGGHPATDAGCLTCHSFHAADRQIAEPSVRATATAHCRACHQPGTRRTDVSPGHRQAADLVYHDPSRDLSRISPSDACLICHGASSANFQLPAMSPPPPRFNTHASHPFGIRVVAGSGRGAGRIVHEIDPACRCPTAASNARPATTSPRQPTICWWRSTITPDSAWAATSSAAAVPGVPSCWPSPPAPEPSTSRGTASSGSGYGTCGKVVPGGDRGRDPARRRTRRSPRRRRATRR